MIVCIAENINKTWGGTTVLTEVTLDIHEGERIGLVGPNGCGKTTLLKLLAGIEPPDAGVIHRKKGCRTALLAQIPDYGPDATALDVLHEAFGELLALRERMTRLEITMASPDPSVTEKALREYGACQEEFAAQGGYEMDSNVARVASGLGIKHLLQTPFASLSGGERTKVCLGRILLLRPDLLLLDEPTNHLDLDAVEWLESHLQDYAGSVLIVSHDRYFLDRVVNKIYDLEGGRPEAYHGNYSFFVEEKERRLLLEFAAYQEQQKKIAKMEEAIKRMKLWAAQADNPAMFRRAASMQKALDRIFQLDRPVLERKRMGLAFSMNERSGKDVFVLEGVKKSFSVDSEAAPEESSGMGETSRRTLYAGLHMQVRFGEAIAIVGGNGSGKTTLLRLLVGQAEPDEGTVRLGSNVKIGYLAQQDWFSDESRTILEVFRDTVMVEEGEARRLLARFLFYGASVFRQASSLSGGERMRLRLAQLMHQELNVLVLDEPTNHLDIDAREALEETLAAFPGTIVCVSHDRYLLNKLFPVTYWLERGTMNRYEGHYAEARMKREELRATRREASGEVKEAVSGNRFSDSAVTRRVREPQAESGGASAGQRDRHAVRLENDIALTERKIELLEKAMMTESDVAKLSAMHGEKELLEAERELLYERLVAEE
ncbi:ribosomal protection-like ABC-F family protein [Paenibacillus hodogayensis]|uniref:Ribosomal protection-like ABC-F family protein n=1 Tax=Paenibacillus hodogayensis TaxID=279208 RepID=A0ABV5VRE7_9BACL